MSLCEYLSQFWDSFVSFANSNFMVALISAFAGAFAGGTGAYYLERRTRRDEARIQEVRYINASIMTCFNIFLSYMNLKQQCVKPLKENHEAFCNAVNEALKTQTSPNEPVYLENIDPVHVPIDILRQQVLDKISGNGITQAVMIYLLQAAGKLDLSMKQRNEWLKKNRCRSLNSDINSKDRITLVQELVGHHLHDGMIDTTYPDLVEAISIETDDCIWFSKKLCLELEKHGYKLLGKWKWKHKLKINSVDFSKDNGNIPQDSEYDAILQMYRDGDV